MSVKDISIEDEIALGLIRNHQVSSYGVVVEDKPDSALVEAVRREVQENVPGYVLKTEYGMYQGPAGLKRGTRLSMQMTEQTFQDLAFDAFEGYFVDKYGSANGQ